MIFVGNINDLGGISFVVIVVLVFIFFILIGIGVCIVYVWYRWKYLVCMIVGKDFSKFSNLVYNKWLFIVILVRENVVIDDDYCWDIEEGVVYIGVVYDNLVLNMEDDL